MVLMEEILKKLGLENKEIKVYLALLKLGKCTVEKIKNETRIERTHIYKILERLQDKNFATSLIENRTKHFIATEPDKLLQGLKNTGEELKGIIPQLTALPSIKPKEEIKITVYRGKDGLKRLGEELLSTTKEYLVMGEQGRLQEVLPIYSEQFMKKLEEKGVKEKVLAKKGMKVIKSTNTSIRYVSKEFNFPTSTVMYNNNVVIVIWSEPLAIRIESDEVAESYRSQFNALWNISKA
jgi:sugar-specific transcriptional regulator TrmB